jgi:hypothetical protein
VAPGVREDLELTGLHRAAVLALLLATGCGPWGPLGVIPGGPLAGEVVEEPVDDWSFTDAHRTVAIETQGEWIDHSVTVLCGADGRYLYVPSRNPRRKKWVENALRDPRVRIGVDGRIYPGKATRVTSSSEAQRAVRAQIRKYLGVEVQKVRPLLEPPEPGDDRAEVWIFRVESTGDGGSSAGAGAS